MYMNCGRRTSRPMAGCFIPTKRTTRSIKYRISASDQTLVIGAWSLVICLMTVPATTRRLDLTGRHAPGHARFAVGREIAERYIDQQPLLQHAVHRGSDFFLQKRQARIAKVLGLGSLHKGDNRIAHSLFEFW